MHDDLGFSQHFYFNCQFQLEYEKRLKKKIKVVSFKPFRFSFKRILMNDAKCMSNCLSSKKRSVKCKFWPQSKRLLTKR